MRRWARGLTAGALALAALALGTEAPRKRPTRPSITVGATARRRRSSATRTRPASACSSRSPASTRTSDGVTDRVAIDIIRPEGVRAEPEGPGDHRRQPVLHVARPRQRDAVHPHDRRRHAGQVPAVLRQLLRPARLRRDRWRRPIGTAFSTGCPLHGGPGDVAGFKAVIDWIEGRVPGYTTADGNTPVTADWYNGKNAMIGKSYDGTFANGVAATGVDGPDDDRPDLGDLRLVRLLAHGRHPREHPLPAQPRQQHHRERSRGARSASLPPDHRTPCANVFTELDTVDGDADGDINPFWQDRNYAKDVAKVKAAVFESHGINDDNVRPDHFAQWWAGLRREQRPAQALALRRGPRRSVRLPPRRVGRHAAPLVRLLAPGRPERHHERAAGRHREQPGNVWKTYAAGPSRTRRRTTSTCRARAAGATGRAHAHLGRRDRHAHVHGREPQRDQLPLAHEHAGAQACSSSDR